MSEVWKSYILSSQMRLLGGTPHIILNILCTFNMLKNVFNPCVFLPDKNFRHMPMSVKTFSDIILSQVLRWSSQPLEANLPPSNITLLKKSWIVLDLFFHGNPSKYIGWLLVTLFHISHITFITGRFFSTSFLWMGLFPGHSNKLGRVGIRVFSSLLSTYFSSVWKTRYMRQSMNVMSMKESHIESQTPLCICPPPLTIHLTPGMLDLARVEARAVLPQIVW